MKAKIVKEIEPSGNHFFLVYANDAIAKSLLFKPDVPAEDARSEKSKLAEAMELVKNIEQGLFGIKETIYETPEEKLETTDEGKI